jgi:hypothetical protein
VHMRESAISIFFRQQNTGRRPVGFGSPMSEQWSVLRSPVIEIRLLPFARSGQLQGIPILGRSPDREGSGQPSQPPATDPTARFSPNSKSESQPDCTHPVPKTSLICTYIRVLYKYLRHLAFFGRR